MLEILFGFDYKCVLTIVTGLFMDVKKFDEKWDEIVITWFEIITMSYLAVHCTFYNNPKLIFFTPTQTTTTINKN